MDRLAFLPVRDEHSIETVVSLANEIWREHYTPIIGKEQVEYMLEKFQSAEAIAGQIREGYHYFLAAGHDGVSVGYLAVVERKKELFISKIYLSRSSRGQGYGRQMTGFAGRLAREHGLPRVTLTVNRNNYTSIEIYRKLGFVVEGAVVRDIGGGFVMDDYTMKKEIPRAQSERRDG